MGVLCIVENGDYDKENFMVNKETKELAIARLKKIEGQIRGVQQMVGDEKYCIDIINQVHAAKKALDGVALLIMKRHVNSCVADAIKSKGGEAKVNELIETVDKFMR